MPLTTTTEIAGPVDVDFQISLLRNAKANCPYFAGSTPAEIAEHSGTFTAKWRRIENLSVPSTALAELTGNLAFPTRTAVQPTVTDLTATLSKFGNFMFLNEEVDLKNFNGQTNKLVEIMGINAGQALNRQQRNVMEDEATALLTGAATTATDLNGGSTASTNLKESDIAVAQNALARENALRFTARTTGSTNINTTPIRPAYLGIAHEDTIEDLRTLTNFVSAERYAGHVELWPNEQGTVGGVRFISTTESTIDTGFGEASTGSATVHGRAATQGQVDVYNTVIYGMDAFGSVGLGFNHVKAVYMAGDSLPGVQLISKAKGSAGAGDPLNEVSSLGWKSWHAAEPLNTAWSRVIRHTVDRLQANE